MDSEIKSDPSVDSLREAQHADGNKKMPDADGRRPTKIGGFVIEGDIEMSDTTDENDHSKNGGSEGVEENVADIPVDPVSKAKPNSTNGQFEMPPMDDAQRSRTGEHSEIDPMEQINYHEDNLGNDEHSNSDPSTVELASLKNQGSPQLANRLDEPMSDAPEAEQAILERDLIRAGQPIEFSELKNILNKRQAAKYRQIQPMSGIIQSDHEEEPIPRTPEEEIEQLRALKAEKYLARKKEEDRCPPEDSGDDTDDDDEYDKRNMDDVNSSNPPVEHEGYRPAEEARPAKLKKAISPRRSPLSSRGEERKSKKSKITSAKQSRFTRLKPRFATKSSSAGKMKSKNTARVTKATKATKAQVKKNRIDNNLFNPTHLRGTDLFESVAANSNRAAPPTFSATNKKDALKQMIASIPEEYQGIAKIDKQQLNEATKKFTPPRSCTAQGSGWKVTGMKTVLNHYQLPGVAFMRERETVGEDEHPKGGIQADAMGLGKTVMMLANIVNGQPRTKKDGPRQKTLIVATPQLLRQWESEIDKHVEQKYIKQVLHYTNGSVELKDNPIAFVQKYDVVLVTYDQVRISYPKYNPPAECTTKDAKHRWWLNHYETHKRTLHRLHFDRIVLDEAQAIKNPRSATSVACRALESTYRWVMSGTPVQNNLEEFYSYFRFLRVPNTGSLGVFKRNYCTEDDTGSERLHAVLRAFMIRRTHNDELMGARLLDLPPPTKLDYWVELSPIELGIYNIVYERVMSRIRGFRKTGDFDKKYSHIWTLHGLLRQIAFHPLMVHEASEFLFEDEDYKKLEKLIQVEVMPDSTEEVYIKSLRVMLTSCAAAAGYVGRVDYPKNRTIATEKLEALVDSDDAIEAAIATQLGAALGRNEAFESAINNGDQKNEDGDSNNIHENQATSSASIQVSAGGKFGIRNDYGKYVKGLRDLHENRKTEEPLKCAYCHQPPKELALDMTCAHIYCQDCWMEVMKLAIKADQDYVSCIACNRKLVVGAQHYRRETLLEAGSPSIGVKSVVTPKKTQQKKLKEARNRIRNWIDKDGNMIPSAKTSAIKAQLLNWFAADSSCKVIINCQFITMIYILEKMCNIEEWTCFQFTGMQSVDKRSKTIKDFENAAGPCIMLASLKAGGVGLNLVMANRVIMADLYWNSAVEEQAFCRIYRKGQTRETVLARFPAKNTVDEDMLEMQQRKDEVIGSVIDNEEKAKRKLSATELLELFGRPKDVSQNGFVVADTHNDPIRVPVQINDQGDLEMLDEI